MLKSNGNISLKSFFIFNSSYGPLEGREDEKIIFYHPQDTSQNSKIKDVGLAEALIKFTGTFSFGESEIEYLKTKKTRQFFLEPECGTFMVLTVNIPFEMKEKDNIEYIDYFPELVNENAMQSTLNQSYCIFRLFQSTFESHLIGATSAIQVKNLISKIESIFPNILSNLSLNNGDITDILQSIQYQPVTNIVFFRIVNFFNTITSIPVLKVKKIIFLYNCQIIYSELDNSNELFALYEYLVSSVLIKFDKQNQEHDKCTGYFISGSELNSPKIYIYNQVLEIVECFSIVVYCIHDCSLVMLLSEDQETNEAHLNDIRTSVGPQLSMISKEIDESYNQIKQNSMLVGKNYNEDLLKDDVMYLYHNKMNQKLHSTLYYNKNYEKRLTSIPWQVMRLISDMYEKEPEELFGNSLVNCDNETIFKTYKDFWILKREHNLRSLYLIVNKNSTLIDISTEFGQLMTGIVKNVYFNIQQ
ncbi:unnamed protein product [Diamesa serratosioi]